MTPMLCSQCEHKANLKLKPMQLKKGFLRKIELEKTSNLIVKKFQEGSGVHYGYLFIYYLLRVDWFICNLVMIRARGQPQKTLKVRKINCHN